MNNKNKNQWHKHIFEHIQRDRFKIAKNGYKIDLWIFQTYFGVLLLIVGMLIYYNGTDLNYFKCSMPSYGAEGSYLVHTSENLTVSMCKNPFYHPKTWENQEYLPDGEYGKDFSVPITYVEAYAILGMGIAAFMNHILYNKKRTVM